MDVRILPDATTAAAAAADTIARRLRRAVTQRGRASLALSGGTTPKIMVSALAERDLPWSAIDVFQVDERVAPDGHPDRNAHLLDLLPAGVRVHPLPVTAADLRRAAASHARRLPDRFDVVHLGLGDDGHTASWPPGDAIVESARLVEVCPEFHGRRRLTLTPIPVNAARSRVLLVTGASKAERVVAWVRRLGDGNLPIDRVRRQGTTVVLDEAAAAGLGPR